jgi:hypothetical protein
MAGRPSSFTQDIADQITSKIVEGYTLRQIAALPKMPDKSTILRWLATNESFRAQYACAKDVQADLMSEDIIDISDDGTNDWITRENQDGSTYEVLNAEHVQRSRLRVDTRKWLMSKLAPKKYGDKVSAEVTGADGAPLVPPTITVNFVRPADPGEPTGET